MTTSTREYGSQRELASSVNKPFPWISGRPPNPPPPICSLSSRDDRLGPGADCGNGWSGHLASLEVKGEQ